MVNGDVYEALIEKFSSVFGRSHEVSAYAPGRVEVLGNHTDYNEGYVLSAAINYGTFFVASPSGNSGCRLVAGDIMEEVAFDIADVKASRNCMWSNYVKGVLAGLAKVKELDEGFLGMFLGNVPLGSGLSSSAALEISSGLALAALYGMDVNHLDLARIGQSAEHHYAGVKCGLLDQISSLFAKESHLVCTDFRTLDVETVPLGEHACFLVCNTNAKHALVDGEYNERRAKCEEATAFFAKTLDHPVAALRDVSWEEWERHGAAMDATARRRAAHVIGENTRVLEGRGLLDKGRLDAFGKLMFGSHESSRVHFENSCPELDFIVDTAARIPSVMGARLSGGGFGGSAVVLLHPRDVDIAAHAIASAYAQRFGHPCDVRVVDPSAGAGVVQKIEN